MEVFPKLTPPRELARASLLTLGLGALLAAGFLPTSRDLMDWLLQAAQYGGNAREGWLFAGFPLLALFFHLSLSKRKGETSGWNRNLAISFLLPCVISFTYGCARHAPGIAREWSSARGRLELAWFIIFAPLGEEWLFRGWVYDVADRLWPESFPTATNPLPLAVWASAATFSLWHSQNLGFEPMAIVILQVVYTFFTGLWLGYLRQKTGKVTPGIAAHILLNFAANSLAITPMLLR